MFFVIPKIRLTLHFKIRGSLKNNLTLILSVAFFLPCLGQVAPIVIKGSQQSTIHRYNLPFNGYGQKTIDVWLPSKYPEAGPYDVLYMQDGQMLFDSTSNWNHQEWQADEVVSRLMAADSIRPVIIVGIWNAGTQRHSEYFPYKPLLNLSASFRDSLQAQIVGENYKLFQTPIYSDSYLEFLVKTLKPFIDRNYKVNPQSEHTIIGGSSMGGLISLYALCEYPGIFGAAICMSTHWPGNFVLDNPDIPNAMLAYLRKNLPTDGKHKLYFDHGTEGIDSFYAVTQWKVDALLLTKNFGTNNYLSISFQGANHTERDWARRLHYPLNFILSKQP